MPWRRLSIEKQRERLYLDQARSLLRSLPRGEPKPFESPDFLFKSETEEVGVEITCFSWPGKRSCLDRLRHRIILPRDLQRVLDRKARQLKQYQLEGDAITLLVVLDRRLPMFIGWVTPELLEHRYQTPFGRLVLLESTIGQCWELLRSRRTG